MTYTKLQPCHCEERSDVAIYPIEIASHSFAMTSINSSHLDTAWYYSLSTVRAEGKIRIYVSSAMRAHLFTYFLLGIHSVTMFIKDGLTVFTD